MNSRLYIPCLALAMAAFSLPAFAQVSISLDIAPPPLIVEDQPPIPDDGYIWTPGYWAYDDDQGAYYWVPGAWVQPPEVGVYWTPNYWGWENNAYVYHSGYWGPTVGFYGGVNYGHGYYGNGYGGGRWDNGHFAYNREANNFRNAHVTNVYVDKTVVRPQSNRVSFNGGHGGINARPTPQEQQAQQQNHVQATAQQQSHFQSAQQTRSHEVKVNAHKNAAANGSQQPQGQAAPNAQPASGAQPAVNPTPAANKPDEQKFTGENAQQQHQDAEKQAKHHDQAGNPNVTPMDNQPKTSPENQIKPEAKQEQPAIKNVEKPAAKNEVQPEVKHQEAQVQHAAESHPQGAPSEAKHNDAPGGGGGQHPQAQGPQGQPHQDAKPQGGGDKGKSGGGDKGGGDKGGKDDKH